MFSFNNEKDQMVLWLDNDQKEVVGENMPPPVQLIDELYCIDPDRVDACKIRRIITCYKRSKDEESKKCRFEAPFWSIEQTVVLIPMPKEDGRPETSRKQYVDLHRSLRV